MHNDKSCHDIIFNVSRPQCFMASLTVILDKIMVFSMNATSKICNLVSLSLAGVKDLDLFVQQTGIKDREYHGWIFYFHSRFYNYNEADTHRNTALILGILMILLL